MTAVMKTIPNSPLRDSDASPFEKFDQLFRAVTTVPKAAVEKEEAKERLRNQKKRESRRKPTRKKS
jgi:hypothetical protein